MRLTFFFYLFTVFISIFLISTAHAQISITLQSDLDWGIAKFAATHSGRINLGTDGVRVNAATGISLAGTSAAGRVQITTIPSGSGIVEVKCRRNGRVALNGQRLTFNQTEGSVDVGVPFGSGTACDNLGGARNPIAVIDLSANPTPVILVGGSLRLPNNGLQNGTYLSSNSGGRFMRIRVIYQ